MDTKKLCYICLRITSKPIQYCRYPASPGEETVGGQTRGVESLMSHLFHWRAAVCWRCRRMLLGFRALLLVVTAVVVVQFSGAPKWHDWLQLGLRSHLNVCPAHCTVNACGLSSRSLCTARTTHAPRSLALTLERHPPAATSILPLPSNASIPQLNHLQSGHIVLSLDEPSPPPHAHACNNSILPFGHHSSTIDHSTTPTHSHANIRVEPRRTSRYVMSGRALLWTSTANRKATPVRRRSTIHLPS
jgi:hypothetical protein